MQAEQSMDGLRYLLEIYLLLWPLCGGAVCSNWEAATLIRFLLRFFRDMIVNACVQCMATWDRVEFLNLLADASGGAVGERTKRGEDLVSMLLQSCRRLYGYLPSSEPTAEQTRVRRSRARRRARKEQERFQLYEFHQRMMQQHWYWYMYHAEQLRSAGMPGSSTDAVQSAPSEASEITTIPDLNVFFAVSDDESQDEYDDDEED